MIINISKFTSAFSVVCMMSPSLPVNTIAPNSLDNFVQLNDNNIEEFLRVVTIQLKLVQPKKATQKDEQILVNLLTRIQTAISLYLPSDYDLRGSDTGKLDEIQKHFLQIFKLNDAILNTSNTIDEFQKKVSEIKQLILTIAEIIKLNKIGNNTQVFEKKKLSNSIPLTPPIIPASTDIQPTQNAPTQPVKTPPKTQTPPATPQATSTEETPSSQRQNPQPTLNKANQSLPPSISLMTPSPKAASRRELYMAILGIIAFISVLSTVIYFAVKEDNNQITIENHQAKGQDQRSKEKDEQK